MIIKSSRNQSGFTLIELVIVMALIGIVASIAYPSFKETVRINKIQAQATELMLALVAARSEAIKTNQRTILCKSANGTTCSTDDDVYWDDGWIVFRDEDEDGVPDSANGEILRLNLETESDVTIRTFLTSDNSFFENGSMADSIIYWPDGRTNIDPPAYFKVCAGNNARGMRTLFVDTTGRPRIDTTERGACPS